MNKKLLIQESRGSMIDDLDDAVVNGYKVRISYLNKKTSNIVTRSVYLFCRGLTVNGKTCYRAFQYNPTKSNFEYFTKKKHGWRLFDVEFISNYEVLRNQSKLWIKGELPNWVSKINTENDSLLHDIDVSMDISLFMDKHDRGNSSLEKRKDYVKNNTPTDDPMDNQLGIFDSPELGPKQSTIKPSRTPRKRNNKKIDNSNQLAFDFDTEEDNVNNNDVTNNKILKKSEINYNDEEDIVDDISDEKDDSIDEPDENTRIEDIKESIIIKKKNIWIQNY